MEIEIPGFSLGRQIGKGGMAVVHEAIQENFERKVAIKVLIPSMEVEHEYAERFIIEAKTVATLNHPHIIPVYDVGKIGSHYYIAMEHLPGNTLKYWSKAGLEEAEILEIMKQVADALHYAHGKGIVHRDIKTENIMFREDNSAVLTDFGIARSDKSSNLTQEGTMIGTPAYMSPEQARGLTLDRRSDVYSLGIVFYEMLCKKVPYTADDPMGVALAQVAEPVPTLPPQFAKYQSFLDKIMAKDIDERFDSCLAAIKAIKEMESQGIVGDTSNIGKKQSAGEPVMASQELSEDTIAVVQSSQVPESESDVALQEELERDRQASIGAKKGLSIEESLAGKDIFADVGSTGSHLPEKSLNCDITEERKNLLFKVSKIQMEVVSEDLTQLNVQFTQVSQKILDWYEAYGKGAKVIDLTFYCKPWLVENIEALIQRMVGTKDPFGFIRKLDFRVKILDMAGKPLVEHTEF